MRRVLLLVSAMMLMAAPVAAQEVMELTCGQNAQTIDGDPGTVVTVSCPAGCGASTIWGTGVYSDDSAICTAAIHAGVLTPAGGQAVVTIAPGQTSYPSSLQNGVTSSEWGNWGRSFVVTPVSSVLAISCTQNAQTLAGDPGAVHVVQCAPGCSGGTIWGTGVYSDDSAVCLAAVHAGVITAEAGGIVVVTIAPGQPGYPPSTQNGVTSSEWGSWGRSYVVAAPAP